MYVCMYVCTPHQHPPYIRQQRHIATVLEKRGTLPVAKYRVLGQMHLKQLEDLLEYYFTAGEYIQGRLRVLRFFIADTEQLVEVKLDVRRNELVAMQLVTTVLTLGLAAMAAVGAVFGMNLTNEHETSYSVFVIVSIVSTVACVVIVVLLLGFAQMRHLLYIPDSAVLGGDS